MLIPQPKGRGLPTIFGMIPLEWDCLCIITLIIVPETDLKHLPFGYPSLLYLSLYPNSYLLLFFIQQISQVCNTNIGCWWWEWIFIHNHRFLIFWKFMHYPIFFSCQTFLNTQLYLHGYKNCDTYRNYVPSIPLWMELDDLVRKK